MDPDEEEEIKREMERLLAMSPEQRQQMRDGQQAAREAQTFAEEMIPDGRFDEEETVRRRELWALWVLLPQGEKSGGIHQQRRAYVGALAAKMAMPAEWVRQVLNLAND